MRAGESARRLNSFNTTSKFVFFFIFRVLEKRQKAFSFLKRRLDVSTVKKLDKLLTVRWRLVKLRATFVYLEKCLENGLLPKDVSWKIQRSGLRQSPEVCAHLLQAEIADCNSRIQLYQEQIRELSKVTLSILFPY